MKLPFTVDQFFEVFEKYNNAVWPIQVFLNLAALAAVIFAIRRFGYGDRIISIFLGMLWLWAGLVYHIEFFSAINHAAYAFGVLFVIQGLLFIWAGVRKSMPYQASVGWEQSIGIFFIIYALLVYPILGMKFGHFLPYAPSFGTPCPTTIFTFGLLLWTINLPRYILIIPALWSIVGFSAVLTMGVYEDIGLLVSGVVGTILAAIKSSNYYELPAA